MKSAGRTEQLKIRMHRKEYKVMAKVRHVLVTVIGDASRWKEFALKVKRDNMRRPAFQEEFGKVVPGWRELE